MDLAEAVEFDLGAAEKNIQRVRPGMPVLKVSSKRGSGPGSGMDEWLRFLIARLSRQSAIA
jgi:hydrogenase nickel incorporation protein HypB